MIGIGVNIRPFLNKVARAAADYYNLITADGGVSESPDCVNSGMSDLDRQNLLNNASLLLIPSGYKGGKLYAEIPTNGNGDLTWTRGSDAFRTNASGLIQRVPWNLLQYSEQFDNAVWGKDLGSITYNQSDPFGGNNAALCTFTNLGTSRIFQNYSIVAGNTYTLSAWIKGVNITEFRFLLGTNQAVFVTSQIVNGEWIRVSATVTATTTGTYQQSPARSNNTNGESFYIYGAQLVEGTTAQTYLPTTDRLGFPRLDYTYGSCPSALLEPQRTNSIRNSTMVGASTSPSTLPTNWVRQNTSGLTESVVGIGTENGVNYIDINLSGTATGANDAYSFDQTISASIGQTWTNSWYFKLVSSTPNAVRLAIQEFNSGAFLNVVTQDIAPTTSLARYVQTKTLVGTGVTNVRAMIYLNFVVGQSYNTTIRIAQPQMELGAYATTPILTTGSATATRVADSFSRNNIFTNGLITSSGGTWFVELRNNVAYTRDSVAVNLFLGDNISSPSNALVIRSASASATRLSIQKVIAGAFTILATPSTDTIKVAFKWNGTSADVFVNGTKEISATAFTTTNMEFLACTAPSVPLFIQQMALFPTPLSDTDCELLTGTAYSSYESMATALGYYVI